MKTLTLLRHAKSGWDDPALSDFERPLTARGRQAARAMGREAKALGLGWDAIIASPAMRVTETLAGLAEIHGPLDAHFDTRIYLAPPETLLALVRATDDRAASLLLVGHNPGMERLALLLSRGGALREEVALKYPTGALTEISLPIDHWADAAESSGTITRFLKPRDLED
jgi:phosphohistidine phosphatase